MVMDVGAQSPNLLVYLYLLSIYIHIHILYRFIDAACTMKEWSHFILILILHARFAEVWVELQVEVDKLPEA